MRKVVWIWVLVAFFVGLLPGTGAAVWLWQTNRSTRAVLVSRNSELNAENKALRTRLDSAEASVSALGTRLDQAQAATSGGPAASAAGAPAGSGTPSGTPDIVARSVSPTDVTAGAKLALTIRLTGHATIAKMRITGPAGFDKIYDLARKSYNSSGEVWENVITSPSGKGTYKFYALAYDATNTKHTMPATAGYVFTVK